MTEGQFYTRMIMNIIIGIMFIYAMQKMAVHNNAEKTPQKHRVMKGISIVFILLSIIFGVLCIMAYQQIYFPAEMLEPTIGPNTIIRSPDTLQFWGEPTFEQFGVLNNGLSVLGELGLATYFFYFRWSNSKWWKKILKFLLVVFMYGLMPSVTKITYLDFWGLMPLIIFVATWFFVVRRCKNVEVNNAKETDIDNVSEEVIEQDKHEEDYCRYMPNRMVTVVSNEITPINDCSDAEDILPNNQQTFVQPDESQEVLTAEEESENKEEDIESKNEKVPRDITFAYVLLTIWNTLVSLIMFVMNLSIRLVRFVRKVFTNVFGKLKMKRKLIALICVAIVLVVAGAFTYVYITEDYLPQKRYDKKYSELMIKLASSDDDLRYNLSKDVIYNYHKYWVRLRYDDNIECRKMAWKNIEDLAYKGYAKAQCLQGLKYYYDFENSEWMDKGDAGYDANRYAYWMLQAAKQGLSVAQNNLGVCYEQGRGVEKDMEKAIYWFRKSANNGNDLGQVNLGDCFRDGYKEENGYHWKKIPDYQGYYDWAWKNGYEKVIDYKIILEQNIDSAMYYWRKAAAQGNAQAKERLEKIYE